MSIAWGSIMSAIRQKRIEEAQAKMAEDAKQKAMIKGAIVLGGMALGASVGSGLFGAAGAGSAPAAAGAGQGALGLTEGTWLSGALAPANAAIQTAATTSAANVAGTGGWLSNALGNIGGAIKTGASAIGAKAAAAAPLLGEVGGGMAGMQAGTMVADKIMGGGQAEALAAAKGQAGVTEAVLGELGKDIPDNAAGISDALGTKIGQTATDTGFMNKILPAEPGLGPALTGMSLGASAGSLLGGTVTGDLDFNDAMTALSLATRVYGEQEQAGREERVQKRFEEREKSTQDRHDENLAWYQKKFEAELKADAGRPPSATQLKLLEERANKAADELEMVQEDTSAVARIENAFANDVEAQKLKPITLSDGTELRYATGGGAWYKNEWQFKRPDYTEWETLTQEQFEKIKTDTQKRLQEMSGATPYRVISK